MVTFEPAVVLTARTEWCSLRHVDGAGMVRAAVRYLKQK
jgi:hypothetical protein